MTPNNTEMFRPLNEPGPRHEPLIDGFEELPAEEKGKIYQYSRARAGLAGVRSLEAAIRNKIQQKTTGGPFALRKAFKYFDRDGSGSIDPDEFYAAMDFFGLQFTADQVLGLFGEYDDDCSGSLEYYEFVEKLLDESGTSGAKGELKAMLSKVVPIPTNKIMSLQESRRASLGTVRNMFDKFDVNHSGSIDVRELRFFLEKLGAHVSTDEISKLMESFDINNDGEIQWGEFWEWWQSQYAKKDSPSKSPEREAAAAAVISQRASGAKTSMNGRASMRRPQMSPTADVKASIARSITPSLEVQQRRGMARNLTLTLTLIAGATATRNGQEPNPNPNPNWRCNSDEEWPGTPGQTLRRGKVKAHWSSLTNQYWTIQCLEGAGTGMWRGVSHSKRPSREVSGAVAKVAADHSRV